MTTSTPTRRSTNSAPKMSRRQQAMLENKLRELEAIEFELQRRTNMRNPMHYDLPDLMFEKGFAAGKLNVMTGQIEREPLENDETDAEYYQRQADAVKALVEEKLNFLKDGRTIRVKMIKPQVEFITDLLFGYVNRAILWKGRGCLTSENKVMTQRGLIPISDVTTDDSVINRDGELVPVFDVVPRDYDGKIVRLKVNGNGQDLGFTPDHRILAVRPKTCWNKKVNNGGKTVCTEQCTRSCKRQLWKSYAEEWIEARHLRPGDLTFVPRPVTSPERDVVEFTGTSNQHWGGMISFEASPEFFRLIGYYLAEGSSNEKQRRVKMSFEDGKDDVLIEDVKRLTRKLFGLKAGIERDGKKIDVRICSAGLARYVASFGKRHTKGADLGFLRTASDECLMQLIVGMLAGDGHWDGTSVRASWCSSRNAATFLYACWRLGFAPSYRMTSPQKRVNHLVNKSGPQFYLQLSGTAGRKVASAVWKVRHGCLKNQPMNTQRRWESRGKLFSRVDRVRTERYVGQVWDLEIPDGSSFVLPYLIAHNSGGSLSAAILIWLALLYRNMSFVDLGGSMEQSRVVYEYVCAFWDCFPEMKKGLLEKAPLITNTKLVTGVQLKCIPASEKMARGKHLPGLVADEACQEDTNADSTFKAAMNITMSEPEHMIVLLSTFHIPVGLFQQVWDNAEAKGFKRYRWDIFDVMQPCQAGLDQRTDDDPMAIESFCKMSCPLTQTEVVYDEDNNVVGQRFLGCCGKGRTSTGFLPRENVINALVMNEGSEVFHIEYACFPAGTKITTEAGLKSIQDVQVGESVLTHSGNFKRVTSTFERFYEGPMVSLGLAGTTGAIEVTPSHPILVERRRVKRVRGTRTEYVGTGTWEWTRADQISEGDLVQTPTWSSTGTGEISYKKYTPSRGGTKVSDRTLKLDRDAAWFLGLWTGDGYLDGDGIGLSLGDDKKHAPERAIALAKSKFGVSMTKSRFWKKSRAWNVRGRSKGIAELLRSSIGRYSFERHVPSEVFSATDRVAIGFIEGLVAADGCVDSKSVRIGTTSEELATGVRALFYRLSTRSSIHVEEAGSLGHRKTFVIRISRSAWDDLRNHASAPLTEMFESTRIGKFTTSRVKSVSADSFAGPVYNIEVSDDNSYVVGPMAVHNCNRPRFSGPIYGLEAIEHAVIDEMQIDDNETTLVGIDWGVNEGVMVLGKDSPINGPQVIASKYLSVKLVSEYIRTLDEWQAEYGPLDIYADSAGQFAIGDLEEAGYEVTPVDFGSVKDYGIANLTKMFLYSKIQILSDNDRLIEQLKAYRRDPKNGKPIKIDDHGPDALLCLAIEIDFVERWGDLITARARKASRPNAKKALPAPTAGKDGEVEEKAIDTHNGVMLF